MDAERGAHSPRFGLGPSHESAGAAAMAGRMPVDAEQDNSSRKATRS